jgi:5-methylcytosine-specific restriction endonuclease McrBC regulatory subunit McrC
MKYLSVVECKREIVREDWFDPDLLPPAYEKYFSIEIDQLTRRFAIQAESYVGIVPLNDDCGILIRPKSGLKNLTYMLYRSGLLTHSLETPFDKTVPYDIPEDDLSSFLEGLVQNFLQSLDVIKQWGLMRKGELTKQDLYVVKGRIDYLKWINRLPYTGGLPLPQKVFIAGYNNLANRVLHRCLRCLLDVPLSHVKKTDVIGRLDYFGRIEGSHVSAQEMMELEHQIDAGQFPSSRYYYLPAINLALMILRGTGLALGDDHQVTFKPILINTSLMFEKYIRALWQEVASTFGAHADDGKNMLKEFYKESAKPVRVAPDIVVKMGQNVLSVADMKYKFSPTEQDHYQMWAYMHAYQVKRAGFVSIADAGVKQKKNPAFFKRDEYAVFDFSFDCREIKASESQLKEFIKREIEIAFS